MTISCSYNSACARLERYINLKRFSLKVQHDHSRNVDTFTAEGEEVAVYEECTGLTVHDCIRKYALTLGDLPGGTAMRTHQWESSEEETYQAEGRILARQEAWSVYD